MTETGKIQDFKYVISYSPQAVSGVVQFYVYVGARDEYYKESKGLSHFVEHMMFRGTSKYPTSSKLYSQLYQYGATINAMTDYDYTLYYIDIPPDHINVAIEILFDMMYDSIFPDIDVERGAILNEMLSGQSDSMNFMLTYMMHSSLYQGTLLQMPVIGTEKNIDDINETMIKSFLSSFYKPTNITISINSNQKIDSIKKILQEAITDVQQKIDNMYGSVSQQYNEWNNIKKHDSIPELKLISSNNPLFPISSSLNYKEIFNYIQQKKHWLVSKRNTDTTYIGMGIRLPYKFGSEQTYIVDLIGTILTGGILSRLFIAMREQAGLIYSITYDYNIYKDSSEFIIYYSTYDDKEKINKSLQILFTELNKICTQIMTDEDLNQFKGFITNKLKLSLDKSSTLASINGNYYMYLGKIITIEQLIQIYKVITPQIILDTSKQIIHIDSIYITMIVNENIPENTQKCSKNVFNINSVSNMIVN